MKKIMDIRFMDTGSISRDDIMAFVPLKAQGKANQGALQALLDELEKHPGRIRQRILGELGPAIVG
jgi:hypothetical protein